jgi:hypothetical protein
MRFPVSDRLKRLVEEALAAKLPHEGHLDSRQLPCRGDDIDAVDDVGDHRIGGSGAPGQDVDEVHAEPAHLDPELSCHRGLGIAIDSEDTLAAPGEADREVDRGGRLADPALLVGDADDHQPTSFAWL